MKILYILLFVTLFCFGCAPEKNHDIKTKDGVEINFTEKGSNEPTLLFIHGWSNDKSIWDEQMVHFTKDYKVVAIDLPGFGESGNNRTNWTIESYGDDVVSAIEQLNLEEVVLVGFSMGGAVVIDAAEKAKEKVIGIVLVDILQDVEMQYTPEMYYFLDSVYMDIAQNPTMEKMVKGGFIKKDPAASYDKILKMLTPENNESKKGWSESFLSMFNWLKDDCTSAITQVKVPIIAINSDSRPTNVEGFRKYHPTFEVKIIRNSGHVLMWDATDEFNQLLTESILEFANSAE